MAHDVNKIAGLPADLGFGDLFTMDLKYDAPVQANAPTNTTVTPEYGGNITQMTWQTRGREKQSYTFKYDYINRMTEADYADISNAGAVTNDRYTEKLTYDIRGNIQTLQRYGLNSSSCAWGQIDNLVYQYDPYNQGYNPYNKVYKITDYSDASLGFVTQSNGSAYTYDVDGNMTADPNKGITGITYNHLNLPTVITFTNNRTITFLYDAGGNKLRKTVINNGTTLYTQNYVNGIEYKNNVLEAIYHREGRVTNIDNVLKYEYALKDHLGNTRIMFCDRNGDGYITPNSTPEQSEITQENSYYAFGMNMEFGAWENTPSITDNLHQYNGKELNTDLGLNLNDYGARFYDPTVGRWSGLDPQSEKYTYTTPYGYTLNNPIIFIDPDGKDVKPSKAFLGSAYGRIFQDLRENNSAFGKAIAKYENNKNFNLTLGVDNAKVKAAGAGAVTESVADKSTIKISANVASFYLSSTTVPGNSNYRFSSVGVVLVVAHEVIHQKIALTSKQEDDSHNTFNTERQSLVKILSEYSEDNKLGLSSESITALSFAGQQDSKEFKNYINDLAKENGTAYKEEKAKYDKLVSNLIYEKKN